MDRFECAVASLQRSEALFATASPVRRWLLVEVRGAWGRDCVWDTKLGGHVDPAWRKRIEATGARILAVRRDLDIAEERSVRLMWVVSGAPGDLRTGTWSTTIDHLDDVMAATESVPFGIGERAPSGWEVAPAPAPIALVCTNGRHDSCCATYGRPLVRALRSSRWEHQVWESTHVGGDRFAANVVMLPQGLYYGRVDPDVADQLFAAHHRGELLVDHYRGRSVFGFAEQAAEYFVRSELALVGIDAVTNVERDREHGELVVTIDTAPRRLAVVLERTMSASPTPLTCKGADGLSYPTYRLVALRSRDDGAAA